MNIKVFIPSQSEISMTSKAEICITKDDLKRYAKDLADALNRNGIATMKDMASKVGLAIMISDSEGIGIYPGFAVYTENGLPRKTGTLNISLMVPKVTVIDARIEERQRYAELFIRCHDLIQGYEIAGDKKLITDAYNNIKQHKNLRRGSFEEVIEEINRLQRI